VIRPALALLFALWCGALPLEAQTSAGPDDLARLRTHLEQRAGALLERDGITFYALGAMLHPDGSLEEFTPDRWPRLDAPPPEWGDSLFTAFRRSGRPARAVPLIVDLGRSDSGEPRDTFALFHGETGKRCQELRLPMTGLGAGSLPGWGVPQPAACAPRFGLAADSSAR
jgi:hypothetical protein